MNQSAYTPKRIESRDIYHRPGQDSLSAEKERARLGEKDSKSNTHFFTNLTSVNIATAFARARITADTINNRPQHLKGASMSPSQLPRMNHKDIPDAHDPRGHFESSQPARPYGSTFNTNNDGLRPIRDITNRAQSNPYGSHNYGHTTQSGYQGMDIDSGYEHRDAGSVMPDGFLRERDWKNLQSGVPSWLKKAQDKRPNDLMQISPPRGIMDTPSNALGRSAMGGGASAPSFDPLMDNLIGMKTSHPPRDTAAAAAAAAAAARRLADEALADNDYLAGTTASRGNYRNTNINENTLRRGIDSHAGASTSDNGPFTRAEPARTNVNGGAAASNFPATNSGMPPRTGNTLSRNPSARSAATATGRGGSVAGRGGGVAGRGGAAGRGGGAASRGGGAAAFVKRMREQQRQEQQQQQQEQNEQEQQMDQQHQRDMLNGAYGSGSRANPNEYSSAFPEAADTGHPLRPSSRFSVRSRVGTPARSIYGQDFGLDEDEMGSARYLHKTPTGAAHSNGPSIPTPYTARIKGPGAFPATAQRYSQRRPNARNLASNIDDDEEVDMISPTMSRGLHARQASNATSLGKGSLLGNHCYLSHGSASNRGWDAYANRSNTGEHVTSHSFSDSFASNSSAGHHDSDIGRDNPTLLRRLVRNIAAGWAGSAGSFAERVSFVFFMIYFLVKETFVVVGAFVFRLLVSLIIGPVYSGVRETVLLPISLWRMVSPGNSRDTARSMTGILTGFTVVALSVIVSQYGSSTLSGLGSVPGSILGGVWSPSMRPPLSITPPTGLEPLTDEEIDRLGGQGSAAVERLVNVEQTLRHLYGLLDTLRSYRDEETQEVRESLKRMQQEKQALMDANRGEKKRVDNLEREYSNIKRDIKAQLAKSSDASKHAKEIENLKRRVDQLMRGGAGKGSGPGLEEVRKLVNDAIGKQERELKDMLKPEWLTTDGDAAYTNVARMIDDALSRYANDRLGKTDFALFTAGARIVPGLTSPTFEPPARGFTQRILRKLGMVSSQPPAALLDPDTHVGECWPMLGSSGQVGIHLSQPVDVSEFAIEHVAKSVAIDWRSAPRKIEVWGYVLGGNGTSGHTFSAASSQSADPGGAEHDNGVSSASDLPLASASASAEPAAGTPSADPAGLPPISIPLYLESSSYGVGKLELLAWYEYEPSDSSSLQVFRPGNGSGAARVQTLVLKVKSNWGHPGHTCLYRFRVHGHRAAPPAEAAAP